MIQPKQKRKSGSRETDDEGIESEKSGNLEDHVDALFKLPLAEFTGARNDLAARLKRERCSVSLRQTPPRSRFEAR